MDTELRLLKAHRTRGDVACPDALGRELADEKPREASIAASEIQEGGDVVKAAERPSGELGRGVKYLFSGTEIRAKSAVDIPSKEFFRKRKHFVSLVYRRAQRFWIFDECIQVITDKLIAVGGGIVELRAVLKPRHDAFLKLSIAGRLEAAGADAWYYCQNGRLWGLSAKFKTKCDLCHGSSTTLGED